ncbi:hypothetical protein ACHAW6_012745 [Cyclotella cf. meneghiniana]
MRRNHTFGCPVYALHNALAAGNKIPKWSPRARLVINLEPSPFYARNINLVLNLDNSHCSPPFHFWYNDFFETININKSEMMMSSNWQILAGLVRLDNIQTVNQIIQPFNHAQPIQGNVTPVPPSQSVMGLPEKLPFVNFRNFDKPLQFDLNADVAEVLLEQLLINEPEGVMLPTTPGAYDYNSHRNSPGTLTI